MVKLLSWVLINALMGLFLYSCVPAVGELNIANDAKFTTVTVTGTKTALEGSTLTLTVHLSKASETATLLQVALTSSRNDVAADFTSVPTDITIAAGDLSAQLQFTIANDALYEGNETFTLTLSSSDAQIQFSPAQTSLMVQDANAIPQVTVDAISQTVNEQDGTVTVVVDLDVASGVATTIPYTYGGTASYLSDHNLVAGHITIPASSTSGSITFTLTNDVVPESSETIVITLGTPTNAVLGAPHVHTVTILDNDLGVQIEQAAAQTDPSNGTPVAFDITFSQAIDPTTFDVTDITQTGTATGVTWTLSTSDNIAYVLNATVITGDGTLIPSISAGNVTTVAGYANLASTSTDHSVQYDSTAPTLTIARASGQDQVALSVPIDFTITFNEVINTASFTTADISNLGTSPSITWSIIDSGDHKTFTLRATAATAGSLFPWIAAGQVTDLAGNTNAVTTSSEYSVLDFAVVPIYASNGRDWNDYVDNDGADYKTATGAACDVTGTSYKDCRHAGELRMVSIPGVTSCAGLTAVDDLGWFDWSDCDTTPGYATFYAKRLKSGKGLRDLIDPAGNAWLQNRVTISGAYNGSSVLEAWWSNTVEALPDNSATGSGLALLSTPSTIYTLTASAETQGYAVTADKIGVVTLGTSVLSYGGDATSNFNSTTGSTTVAPDKRGILILTGVNHAWIETKLYGAAANAAEYTLAMLDTNFSKVTHTKTNIGEVIFRRCNSNRFIDTAYSGWGDVTLDASTGNYFEDLGAYRKVVQITTSPNNTFNRAMIVGSWTSLWCDASSDGSIYNQINAVNSNVSGNAGFTTSSSNLIISFSTTGNHPDYGYVSWTGGYNTYLNMVSINNTSTGFMMHSNNSSIFNLVSAYNTDGVHMHGGANNIQFGANILVGSNSGSGCINWGTNPGFDNNCVGTDLSLGNLNPITNADPSASFLGGITADDAANASDTGATVFVIPDLTTYDFLNYDTIFRTWSLYADPSNVNSSNRGVWWGGAGGRIWDWSLSSADSVLLNRSGDGQNANGAFVNGAVCPSEIDGNATQTDMVNGEPSGDGSGDDDGLCEPGELCSGRTFLTNAMEIFDDDIGDDNGLCESNEACIYAPNFGAYQGHGDYTTTSCIFQDGTVSGVTMYAYPNNGR